MNEKVVEPVKRRKRSSATLLAWCVVAFVIYVLSAGPAKYIVYRWGSGFDLTSRQRTVYETVYAPLQWLAEHSPQPVEAAWSRYIEFFYEYAYRADVEKWRKRFLAHRFDERIEERPAETTGSTSTPHIEDELRIAGRTIIEWQRELKEIDPLATGSESYVPALIELVKSTDVPWFTQRQAALTLGRMKDRAASAVPVLVALLATPANKPDEAARATPPAAWSAQALALFGPAARSAAPQLIVILRDRGRSLAERLAAVEALSAIGTAHPDVVPALLGFLEMPSQVARDTPLASEDQRPRDDEETVLREAVVEAMAVLGPGAASTVPALTRMLHHSSESLRIKSAVTLGTLGGRAEIAVPMLLEMLAFDESATARDAAGEALGKIGEASIDGLTRLLSQPDAELRRRAAVSLGGIGRAAVGASSKLIPLLDDEEASVRMAATEALWKIDPQSERLVPALVRALGSEERQHRMRAHQLIVQMGPKARPAVELLKELLRDERADVRRLARQTLEKIDVAPSNSSK